MTQHLRLLLGAIIITIFAAPVQAKSFKQAKKLYSSADNSDRQAYAWLKVAADYSHATAAAMVFRLATKLGGNLNKGESMYKQYANTFAVAQ
jgi:hypothetical protein